MLTKYGIDSHPATSATSFFVISFYTSSLDCFDPYVCINLCFKTCALFSGRFVFLEHGRSSLLWALQRAHGALRVPLGLRAYSALERRSGKMFGGWALQFSRARTWFAWSNYWHLLHLYFHVLQNISLEIMAIRVHTKSLKVLCTLFPYSNESNLFLWTMLLRMLYF